MIVLVHVAPIVLKAEKVSGTENGFLRPMCPISVPDTFSGPKDSLADYIDQHAVSSGDTIPNSKTLNMVSPELVSPELGHQLSASAGIPSKGT